VPVAGLVGRAAELDGIARTMRRSRLVTLTGPGGVGKTRLAVEICRRQIDRRPDGVWIVDLTTAAAAPDVALETARTLGVRARGEGQATDALCGYLASRDLLLVLDNCEHVVYACAELSQALLSSCERVQILATSREPLEIDGESIWRLDPLVPADAYRLFVERARERRPAFMPDAETDVTVQRLLDRLDRLPLAIELAAGRVGAMSPEEILAGLERQLGELSAGRLAPSRHKTVRATVEWSYQLLDPDEQRAVRQLSVFVGGFSADAASAVAGLSSDLIARLVDKSLVNAIQTLRGRTRYRLLETVREYARERLLEAGELRAACDAHLGHFARACSARLDGWPSASAGAMIAELGDDYDNVRVALEWAAQHEPCAGLALLSGARDLFFMFGQGDGARLGAQLLERCPDLDRRRVEAQITTGVLDLWTDTPGAERLLEDAAKAATALDEPGLEGWSRLLLGLSGTLAGRIEWARPHLEASKALLGELGDPTGLARSTALLGLSLAADGELDRGRELVGEALAINLSEGDRWGEGHCNLYLGIISDLESAPARASLHYRDAVDAFLPSRDATLLPVALVGQAGTLVRRDPARALQVAAAAASMRARVGSQYALFYAARADEVRAQAEARVGEAAARLWATGARLGLEETVALAFGTAQPREASPAGLSAREREVADLVSEGLVNKEIAARLHLSVRTVESHVRHALAKLGLENRTQLATWARERSP
jgi:predicted ATPase/DNA-binding CsgD family transcriptional regulator